MRQPRGQYHYAIKSLENRLGILKQRPISKLKHVDRIESIEEALAVLRDNDLPKKRAENGK